MKNYIPSDIYLELIKGLSIAVWIIGTFMVVIPVCNWALNQIRGRERLRKLGAPRKKQGSFSLKEILYLREFSEEMEVADMKVSVELVTAVMLIFGFIGFFGTNGVIYVLQHQYAAGIDREIDTKPWMLSAFTAILFASLPYFYVRFRVQRKRHQIALRMIMVVQNLIGHYRPGISIAEVIIKAAETMPEDVVPEWRRLVLSLHMMSLEDGLIRFARRIENHWAEDMADLLMIGAAYGIDISGALHKLVQDMQTAKRNEEKRLAYVTVYRIGTSFMVFASFGIVGFNIYVDGTNFRHYFIEPRGKLLLLVSVVIMFLSMVFVIRSGKKQF